MIKLSDTAEYFTLTQRKLELTKALLRSPDWQDNVSRQRELEVIEERLEELKNSKKIK